MSGSGDKRPSQVLPYLYIGSRGHAKSRGLLKELGIKRILNVTPPRTVDPNTGCPNFFEKEGGQNLLYRRIPIMDNRGEDLLQHLESATAFIAAGQYHGSVLVHCHKGVSRSASIVAAYLMKEQGMTLSEAMVYLKERRPCVNPHEAFMAQLAEYEQRLKEQRTKEGQRGGAAAANKAAPASVKKATMAPARGPSIGPSGPPHQQAPESSDDDGRATREPASAAAAGTGASDIGPAMPERLRGSGSQPAAAAEELLESSIGPALPAPSAAGGDDAQAAASGGAEGSIGPAMPPQHSHEQGDKSSGEAGAVGASADAKRGDKRSSAQSQDQHGAAVEHAAKKQK
eukprot:TRINITY_DN5022_c0_g1_i2.p1 TRINITY_DN5022_c0_g1~~TRINITY_DN5022_c0_g1_i2.p1  ORF type:complete len:343 (-),score=59.62 TRINITY_DN5022_c0_g1_i2:27-1055(-)